MGADGGTIPKRCELVRNKKKKEKIDKNVRAAVSWRTCQITQLPLEKPIVACKLGRLYNKEAIIKAKLDKKLQTNEVTKHIKKLSDVKELRLTDNRSFKDDGPENGDTYYDHNETPWVCPITSIPMNGANNFFVNWQCGCVVSEKAINELKPDVCVSCSGPYDPAQTIMLYPGDDMLKEYEQRIASEHVQKKASRKAAIDSAEAIEEKEQQSWATHIECLIPHRDFILSCQVNEKDVKFNGSANNCLTKYMICAYKLIGYLCCTIELGIFFI
ncbi:rtf2 RING-finger domain-containing protein [Ditylenchus destructor]|nr:rtf2 RING-finger domain-containing protein [Ditylenchus destructor]